VLGRTRRVALLLYSLILVGAFILLSVNHMFWFALILLAAHVIMIGMIVIVARQPADPWTGPRLRKPTK
jgi:hypothetical protein